MSDTSSGASQRPKRDTLLKVARRCDIDVIIVLRLDRLGRSVTDLLTTLQELHQLDEEF